jgi:hypothetical protein
MHLERFFVLDDEDRGLIGRRRGDTIGWASRCS